MTLDRRKLGVILLAVVAIVFYLVLLSTASSNAQVGGGTTNQTTSDAQVSCLEGEELVDTFTGTDDQTTPQFEITGNEWNFAFATTEGPSSTGIFEIVALEGGAEVPGSAAFGTRGDSGRSSQPIDGPSTFSLRLDEDNPDVLADYTLVVCDNVSQDDDDQEPTDQNQRRNQERSEEIINIPDKPLPPTGGLPVYATVTGFVLTGAGLLGLGIGIRRDQRR